MPGMCEKKCGECAQCVGQWAQEVINEKDAEIRELKRVLSKFTDDNRGHLIQPGDKYCRMHGIVGPTRELPCPVAEAQRLVRGATDERNTPECRCQPVRGTSTYRVSPKCEIHGSADAPVTE